MSVEGGCVGVNHVITDLSQVVRSGLEVGINPGNHNIKGKTDNSLDFKLGFNRKTTVLRDKEAVKVIKDLDLLASSQKRLDILLMIEQGLK